MPGYPFRLYCQGGLLHNALASSSLCDTGWGKMTFITFDDVVYGTLLEDSGPDNSGKDFDKRFREALNELCRLGTVRTLLARQRHFAALSPSDIDRLTRAAEQVSFAAGDAILVACETADSYFVIESGSASVSVDGTDRRVLESGDSLGEIGLFRDGVRTATVTAVSPVEAVRIDKSAFIAAFRGDDVNTQPVRLIIDDYFDAMPNGA